MLGPLLAFKLGWGEIARRRVDALVHIDLNQRQVDEVVAKPDICDVQQPRLKPREHPRPW